MPEETNQQIQEQPTAPETPQIQNPDALLRAFESNKQRLEQERQQREEMANQLAAMQKQLEEEREQRLQRDEVLNQMLSTLQYSEQSAPPTPTPATPATPTPGRPQDQFAQLLSEFNAKQKMEEYRKQAQLEGEKRARQMLEPELQKFQQEAKAYADEVRNLQKRYAFADMFARAGGKPSEMDGFYTLYGGMFEYDDSTGEFTTVKDRSGNVVFNPDSAKPIQPIEALTKIRQKKFEHIPSPALAAAAFEDWNQAQGGGSPTTVRRAGGKTVQVYRDMNDAIRKNPGVSAGELASKFKSGEISFDS